MQYNCLNFHFGSIIWDHIYWTPQCVHVHVCLLNIFIVSAYMFVHVLSEQQAHAWLILQVSVWQAF